MSSTPSRHHGSEIHSITNNLPQAPDYIMTLVNEYFDKTEVYDYQYGSLVYYLAKNTKNYEDLKEQCSYFPYINKNKINKSGIFDKDFDKEIDKYGEYKEYLQMNEKFKDIFIGYRIDVTDMFLNRMDKFKQWGVMIKDPNYTKFYESEIESESESESEYWKKKQNNRKKKDKKLEKYSGKNMDMIVSVFNFCNFSQFFYEHYGSDVFNIEYDPVKISNKLFELKIYNSYTNNMHIFTNSLKFCSRYLRGFNYTKESDCHNLLFMILWSIKRPSSFQDQLSRTNIDCEFIRNLNKLYILDPNYEYEEEYMESTLLEELINNIYVKEEVVLYFLDYVNKNNLNFIGAYGVKSFDTAISLNNQDIAVKMIRKGFYGKYLRNVYSDKKPSYLKIAIKDKKYDIVCELIKTHIQDHEYIKQDIDNIILSELSEDNIKLLKEVFNNIDNIRTTFKSIF